MTPAEEKIRDIQRYGVRAQGREELIAYLKGKRVTPTGLIKAYCYDCQAYYADGVVSCENPLCPLYSRHPYRKHTPPEKKSLQDGVEHGGIPDHSGLDPGRNAGVQP